MRTATKVLLLGQRVITYLLRDEFTTDDAAPVASPRTAEPGPGTLTLAQADGQFSISGGKLSFPAQSTPTWGDLGFFENVGRGRVTGRVLIGLFNFSTLQVCVFLAWLRSATADVTAFANIANGFYLATGGGALQPPSAAAAGPNLDAVLVVSTDYKAAIVLRSVGCFRFLKGGAFANWTLLWVDALDNTATVYPGFSNSVAVGTLDYFRVRDLPAPFTTDYGIATLHDAAPVSDTPAAGEANGITDLYFNLPGSPSANLVAAELRYRRQDATNYWSAYIKRNAGNTAWDFLLDSVSAGTPTNRITVTGVGTPDAIRVIHDGNLHDCYTKATTTWSKRGSQVNNAALAAQTGVNPIAGAGTTLTQLDVWPRASSVYAELDRA